MTENKAPTSPPEHLRLKMNKRLRADQVEVEIIGYMNKHLKANLRGDQTIADILSTPDAWGAIQGDGSKALRKGDTVDVYSPDGLVMADHAMVKNQEGVNVWLTKPLRMVNLSISRRSPTRMVGSMEGVGTVMGWTT